MSTSSLIWTEGTTQVGGADLHMVTGGSGEPLLVLHDEMGLSTPLRYAEELANDFTVHMPAHPGFGVTPQLEWIMSVRDLASWYLRAIEEMGLEKVNVLGLSLGGWLAAEMASQSPQTFKKMALVAPPGIRPPTGEILDMFLIVTREYMETSFLDPASTPEFAVYCPGDAGPEQIERWEAAREEACRLTWRPYMYNQALPHLLGRLKDLPTLLVWGEQDVVVPLSAGEAYKQAINGARLEILSGCGHHPEIEKTDEFLGLVRNFFA
ncbi:MAG: alpha/beta hydrolase [Chloroflexi bacterium]|nr:alpha/beta hydrolase [Chloroflexota bacterium]MDA1271075.1 alpha/beta hydrolase [Chloroflexota bacterium]